MMAGARDPLGSVALYERAFSEKYPLGWLSEQADQERADDFPGWEMQRRVSFLSTYGDAVMDRLVYRFARGDSLDQLIAQVHEDFPVLCRDRNDFASRWGTLPAERSYHNYGPLHPKRRADFGYGAIALMLLPGGPGLQTLAQLVCRSVDSRLYCFDVLFKAFVPEWQVLKKYDKLEMWDRPKLYAALQCALAQPASVRSAAMATYMGNWGRLMKPWGWRAMADAVPEDERRPGTQFTDFAFEAALGVCAYDIDDSSFRDHPYYPRDLVEHYRTNLRHIRDAWRGEGVGPGVSVQAPPVPKKTDLSKSKRKGLSRWVELVSDGDIEATEAVLVQVGKLRKVNDVSELSCALASNNVGIHADLKDDETLCSQLDTLAQRRQLEGFDAPPDASAGPNGCVEILVFSSSWFQARGYRLLDLNGNDDAWHAVVVKAEHHDELLALSLQLALTAREPSDVYTD